MTAASGRSYLQGYADALLLQDSQDSLFSTDRSRIENVLPHNAQSFVSRYPLVTVAALGAAAGATFVGTSYLTARLLRRGLKHGQGAAESRYAAHLGKAAQEDAERRIVAEVQAVRRVCRDEIRDIQPAVHNSLAHGLRTMLEADLAGVIERSAAKAVKKEMAAVKDQAKDQVTREDLETTTRELFDQMVMATRDRRVETQGIRSEMMGQLSVIQDLIEGLKADLESAKAPKDSDATVQSAAQSPEQEAATRQAQDQRDAQTAAAAAAYYNYGQVPAWVSCVMVLDLRPLIRSLSSRRSRRLAARRLMRLFKRLWTNVRRGATMIRYNTTRLRKHPRHIVSLTHTTPRRCRSRGLPKMRGTRRWLGRTCTRTFRRTRITTRVSWTRRARCRRARMPKRC